MDRNSIQTIAKIRQAVNYILLVVGLGLLIILGLQGVRQINDRQAVEGRPNQQVVYEPNDPAQYNFVTENVELEGLEQASMKIASAATGESATESASTNLNKHNQKDVKKANSSEKLAVPTKAGRPQGESKKAAD